MAPDRLGDLLAPLADRQFLGELRRGQSGAARLHSCQRRLERRAELPPQAIGRLTLPLAPSDGRQQPFQIRAVGREALLKRIAPQDPGGVTGDLFRQGSASHEMSGEGKVGGRLMYQFGRSETNRNNAEAPPGKYVESAYRKRAENVMPNR
ncbi:MAG: hypothetical protein Kow006_16370 [Gammaproteobacteria bacterium]